MKKFASIILIISILLITTAIAPLTSDTETLPSDVTLKSIVCNSRGDTVTAKMTFNAILDCVVVMAVYDDSGKLLNATYYDSPATASDFSISLSGKQSYLNYPVKIFFWDSLNTIKPLNTELNGTVEPIPTNLAVITEVGKATNNDAEEILSISYLMGGEKLIKDTTTDIATNYQRLSPGDVVKLELNEYDLISSIKYVWDFESKIRDFTTNEPVTLAAGDDSYVSSFSDETFAGGIVTAFDDTTDIATINGSEYKLSKAKNIYVIDNTGRRLNIKTGSDRSFTYFSELYSTSGRITLTYQNGTTLTFDDMSLAENQLAAMKNADHVYVRTYENRPADVIIVKGFLDSVE